MSTPEQSPTLIPVGALNGANTWDLVRIVPDGGGAIVQGRLVSIAHVFKERTRVTIRIDENNLEIPLLLHPELEVEIVSSWRTRT